MKITRYFTTSILVFMSLSIGYSQLGKNNNTICQIIEREFPLFAKSVKAENIWDSAHAVYTLYLRAFEDGDLKLSFSFFIDVHQLEGDRPDYFMHLGSELIMVYLTPRLFEQQIEECFTLEYPNREHYLKAKDKLYGPSVFINEKYTMWKYIIQGDSILQKDVVR